MKSLTKLITKNCGINKLRYITRGKNCLDSRLFKGCSPLQPLCNLTGNRPQTATFHTAKRYPSHLTICTFLKTTPAVVLISM